VTAITPALMPRRNPSPPRPTGTRRDILLTAIQARGGSWTTGRARAYYATALGKTVHKPDVRRDLAALTAAGHLDRHEVSGRVNYTLRTKGGAA
jgi:hypothetical protein